MNQLAQILKRILKGDIYMVAAIVFLMVLSVMAVYSSASVLAYQRSGGDTAGVIMRHCAMLIGGFVILVCTSRIKPGVWMGLAWPLLFIALGLQFLTLVAGTSINGASRWLSVGGISFQPSEISKVALMVFVARQLATSQDNLRKAFWYILAATGAVCLLIVFENLSTCVLIVVSVWIVMAVARVPLLYLGGTAVVVGALLAIVIAFAPQLSSISGVFSRANTWKARIERFVGDDEAESAAGNYQAEQAKAAVATGGVTGKGPGNSYLKNFLPMAFSDFIFAIIIEEGGIIFGCIPVLMAYLVILARSIVIARKCQVTFRVFLIYGLALLFTLQAIINMAVGVSLIPVTGQTLPLVSMGGSSNFVMGWAYGMMLSVSIHMKSSQESPQQQPVSE